METDEPTVEHTTIVCNGNWRMEEMSHGLVRVYRRDVYMDSLESTREAREYIRDYYND